MVQGMLTQHVMESVTREGFSGTSKILEDSVNEAKRATGMNPADRTSLVQLLTRVQQLNARLNAAPEASGGARPGISMPYTVREEAITARKGVQYNSYGHSFAGMSVQFILMMGMETGIVLLMQRQSGLWKRLRAAPVSRAIILAARVSSTTIYSALTFFVVFAFARLVFGVRVEGGLPAFILIAAAVGLMTASFGLLVAAFGRTIEATRSLAMLATILMVMLGGAWVPAFLFPQWLQKVTFAIPARWAVEALDGVTWRGLGFDAAIAPIVAMLGFAVVFAALAVWRFRWDG
jgi:ABC-2 type transport system permease protein